MALTAHQQWAHAKRWRVVTEPAVTQPDFEIIGAIANLARRRLAVPGTYRQIEQGRDFSEVAGGGAIPTLIIADDVDALEMCAVRAGRSERPVQCIDGLYGDAATVAERRRQTSDLRIGLWPIHVGEIGVPENKQPIRPALACPDRRRAAVEPARNADDDCGGIIKVT